MGKFKVCKPESITIRTCPPCDLCGEEAKTVRFYLEAAGKRKMVKGFYPDLSVRLCGHCLREALEEIKCK